MARKETVFQALDRAVRGDWGRNTVASPHVNTYNVSGNDVIYRTTDKDDYEQKKLELQQNEFLKNRWVKANVNLSVTAYAGLNNIKLMYRDADLMDAFPEIGAALDLVSEESVTPFPDNGQVVHISSKSERVKSILEDLFVNRLNLQLTAPMIIRAMCKYGNQFMLLNIDRKNGVLGWKQMPVFNVERIESGIQNPFGAGASLAVNGVNVDKADLSTQFVWLDDNNSQIPFREWQIAHFRLLTNSLYLPYGCLVGDTRIELEDGYKEIKDIKVGDKVWTFNIDTQKRELSQVTVWMDKGIQETLEIETAHNQVSATKDHRFLVYEDEKFKYKEAQELVVGDLLVIYNLDNITTEPIVSIVAADKQQVYDITIDNDNSNFFANGVVTHNCSYLNSARRHWRILSLLEDMMLIYRLERSVERRVYKIYVGAIDDADVPAYMESIANEFKRTPIIDPMTGQVDLRKNILPVHKDTPIPLLDGRTITIEELAKEFENGKENYVYSIQDKSLQIVPGKVVWCGKNYTADKLLKITLDDDTYMTLAPEHEIVMRDGTKKRADDVVVGESVMPLYRQCNSTSPKRMERYEKVYNPNSGQYEYTHRIVARSVPKGQEKFNTVHHINYNKYDNTPNNLLWCDFHEHHKMHSQVAKSNWADENKRKQAIQKLSIAAKKHFEEHPMPQEVKDKISASLKQTFKNPKYAEMFKKHGQRLTEYVRSEAGRKKSAEICRKYQLYKNIIAYNHSKLHEQHNAMRCEVSSKSWIGEGRTNRIAKIRINLGNQFWEQVDEAICNGIVYNRKTLLEFVNTQLIDDVIASNPQNQRLKNYHSISRGIVERELQEKGFATITEYLENVAKINGAQLPSEIVKEQQRQNVYARGFNKYGSWNVEQKLEHRSQRKKSDFDHSPIVFDDVIWDDLRNNIIKRAISTSNDLINYINEQWIGYLLEHNKNARLHTSHKLSKSALYRQVKEKYDLPIGQYIQAMRKNHKIKDIEWVNGDDVYCMTVVGLNGEEDRHNFALCSINQDGSWCKNGVFVSNCASDDLFVPVRDPATPSPVETLPAGQNLTAIDDIKFIQNKVLTALRIPKTFLNFEENVGDGKNLALMDIRFTRVINRIQQAFLMELTRVASIHLFLLGFDDDLTNFTLSMNNPSTQAEQLEIENMQKKIDAIRDAVSDPGNGLPVMSQMRALREILKWSDKQIKENLEEIRLEKGVAAELEKTTQIIKKTGIFDNVDRIYGEPGAEYVEDQQGGQGGMDNGGGMGGGPSGGGMTPPPMDNGSGSELDSMDSSMNADDNGTINGEEGSVPTQDMPTDNTPMESALKRKPLLTESSTLDKLFDKYLSTLNEHNSHLNETKVERVKAYDDDALLINEDFDKMINALGKFVNDETEEQN